MYNGRNVMTILSNSSVHGGTDSWPIFFRLLARDSMIDLQAAASFLARQQSFNNRS